VQADEVKDELEVRFEAAVEWLKETKDTGLLELPKAVVFYSINKKVSVNKQTDAEQTIETTLSGVKSSPLPKTQRSVLFTMRILSRCKAWAQKWCFSRP